MKKEDLFRAMDGIPDELLLRSEEETGKVVRFDRRKRIPLMILSSAAMGIAAGFLFMAVARPMLSGLPGRGAPGSATVASTQEESASAPAMVATAEEEMQVESSQAVSEEETAVFDMAADNAEPVMEEPAAETEIPEEAPETEETQVAGAGETAPSGEAQAEAKTSADLLGDQRRDYVKVEFISAEDKKNGGAPKEPVYSEEGEMALSRAFSEGTAQISLFGVEEEPLYYFYLTKSNGEQEEVVVYEGGYATISTMAGMCMKMPDDVMKELEEFLNR